MDSNKIEAVAQAMVAPGNGIIAMDESSGTIKKRFDAVGVPDSVEHRRAYREMLLTSPGLAEHISGAIVFDETIRQSTKAGVPFTEAMKDAGIIPGIKVDKGAKPLAGFPGELVAEGLDGLRGRRSEYVKFGAEFAKWRAVIIIGERTPSSTCIDANTHALARYAAPCRDAGIAPMIELEVLMDGNHDIETCHEVTQAVLRSLFSALYEHNVMLEGAILKASMVLSGKDCSEQADTETVAKSTILCLKSAAPAVLPGIVFLAGGQSDENATANLNAMNRFGPHPWPLSFSCARAMQQAALKVWAEDMTGNIKAAQKVVVERARDNGLAAMGQWREAGNTAR